VRAVIRAGLVGAGIDGRLADELLDAHQEIKRSFYLGGHRLTGVEGGRFAEAVFRVLEQTTTGSFTPLGKSLDTQKIIQRLAQLPGGSHPDSARLHIPRALRLIYDIRNNRDAAHLADDIDPNIQDATLVSTVADWVLAELLRLFHSVPPDEAQRIVVSLVTRSAPVIQDFDGFLKVLDPTLGVADRTLVLLYQCGEEGATYHELEAWSHPRSRANLKRTLSRLEQDRAFIHKSGDRYRITTTGQIEVERRELLGPSAGNV
jgi:hypothetical protein